MAPNRCGQNRIRGTPVKLSEALALWFIYGMTLDDLVMGLNLEGHARLVEIDDSEGGNGVDSEA